MSLPLSIEDARRSPTIVSICRTVARLTASIPLESESPRIRRILARPNSHQSPLEFRHAIQYAVSLYGNAYIRAIRTSGDRIVALGQLDSARIHVGTDDRGAPLYYDTFNRRAFDTRDILHIRDGGTFDIVSPSRLESGGDRTRLLIEADALISSAFVTGIAAQYVLESDNPLSGKRSRQIVAKLYEMMGRGGPRRNGVVALGDLKLKRIPSVQVADSDLRQLRHDLQAELASLWDVPPFAVSGQGNTRYSNHTAQVVALFRDVIQPNVSNLAERLSMFLDGDVTPRFSEFVKGDWQLLARTVSILAGGPVLTPDEARETFLQLSGVPGGDKLRARRDGLSPEGPGDRDGEEPTDDGSTVIGGNET